MTEIEFSRLVGKYRAGIYRLALCYTKNHADAEDVVQDTFLKLYTGNMTFPGDEDVRAWLFRVAANRCKDLLKSHWYRFSEPLNDEITVPAPEDDDSVVLAAMSKLTVKTRTVIYLYYYEEYSVKEIAELMGDTETAVTSQLWRGRKRLKELLKKADDDEGSELCERLR